MKDVVKSYNDTGEYKTINGQRVKVNRKKRRNNLRAYYAIAVVVAFVILLILCMTVFFRYGPENVEIKGVTLYTNEQILVVGGVSGEGNLMRTDTDVIAERLKKYLVYVEDVSVKKKYPSKLIVSVTEAQKAADVEFNGKYYVVSKSGKLLECANDSRTKGIPLVKGLELNSLNAGSKLETKDTLKTKIFNDLIKQADELGLKKITSIDLSDRTDIILNYNGKIKIYIGSSVDMDYKLKYIKAVIDEKLSDNFKGTLRYNGVNSGISAIPDNNSSKASKDDSKTEKTANDEENTDESSAEVNDFGYTEPEQSVDENGDYNGWQ
jgi:cell division protein FtsQ